MPNKIDPEHRFLIFLHEFAHYQYTPSFKEKFSEYRIQEDLRKKEHSKYFENFPFDEKATRNYLICKKERGFFGGVNVRKCKLNEVLSHPDSKNGFRILNITVGEGIHNTMMYGGHELLDMKYNVNKDEVYITYNTTSQSLSGGRFTEVMKKQDGVWQIIKCYTHSRS